MTMSRISQFVGSDEYSSTRRGGRRLLAREYNINSPDDADYPLRDRVELREDDKWGSSYLYIKADRWGASWRGPGRHVKEVIKKVFYENQKIRTAVAIYTPASTMRPAGWCINFRRPVPGEDAASARRRVVKNLGPPPKSSGPTTTFISNF